MATREPEERADHVSIRIEKKFAHLSYPSSECCIFRMYDHLRKENEKEYEPAIVAIGPYHRGKANLQEMENQKLRYLRGLLNREKETSVDRYVTAIRELEERARNCYAKPISLDSDEFVEMMLLDGFFIIELFYKSKMWKLRDENDHIFQSEQIRFALRRDLILLENQIPFFIVVHLFNMTNRDSSLGIIDIALKFLEHMAPERKLEAHSEFPIDNIKHLLDLVHDCWCFKFAETPRNGRTEQWEFINSATELQEAGVQFKRVKRSNIFDIKFISGALEIPLLSITSDIESFFRNLVAYELCPVRHHEPMHVCDYIVFMDCLINSSKDIHLLRRNGIIESWVGDDAEVYTMWHNLFKVTVTYTSKFSYSEVFNDVNKHCRRHRNVWMANLKRNYFNSPWALVSFLAAVMLLLLTVAQTIFSILSYSLGKGSI